MWSFTKMFLGIAELSDEEKLSNIHFFFLTHMDIISDYATKKVTVVSQDSNSIFKSNQMHSDLLGL